MISAEAWVFRTGFYAKIGFDFYIWHPIKKIWIRTYWLCGNTYERARCNRKLMNVKIPLEKIRL